MDLNINAPLPDVSIPHPQKDWGPPLTWVGMSSIELPVRVPVTFGDQAQVVHVPAKADFQVNLENRNVRGIHMSRLYRLLTETAAEEDLTFDLLERIATEALVTHEGLSRQARLNVRFELPVQRLSLKSGLVGWRTYPVCLSIEKGKNRVKRSVEFQVLYSSTCPASTALAEQLQGRDSEATSFVATPHAQRSWAKVKVELASDAATTRVESLIDEVEGALKTPVQTIVKREDEQEFARLNAENTMFCEDAARRIYGALSARSDVAEFRGEVRHFESLHPHDAVAFFSSK